MSSKYQKLIVLNETESTNKYAMGLIQKKEAIHGLGIFAIDQTQGKGRRGRQWYSQAGENIIFSVIIKADNLSANYLFPMIMAVSRAAYEVIHENVKANVKIKWPNDIYIDDKKAAGILIENTFQGAKWQWSVAGVGMNVNQTIFPPVDKEVTSLRLVSGKSFDVIEMTKQLQNKILERAGTIPENTDLMLNQYNEVLYARNCSVKLKANGRVFETEITGVSKEGLLLTKDVIERQFAFDEVEFRGVVG